MNLLQAAIYAEPDDAAVIDPGSQALRVPWTDPRARALAAHHTDRVTVGMRPDALSVVADDPDWPDPLRGVVRMVEHRGHDVVLHLETGSAPTPMSMSQLELPEQGPPIPYAPEDDPGSPLLRTLARIVPHQRREEPTRYALQPAYDPAEDSTRPALGDVTVRVPAGVTPRIGDTVALAVDIDQLYLFDRSGDRIRLPAGRSPAALGGTR